MPAVMSGLWPGLVESQTGAHRAGPPTAGDAGATAGTLGARPAQTTVRGAYVAARTPLANAVAARPRYPADSFRPSANPRCAGPARSIFITTVIDHASPWLMPSSTLAATMNHHEDASPISSGT